MSATSRWVLGVLLLTLSRAAPAAAQVGLTAQWVYPVESLYIADFTPHTIGRNPDFLMLTFMGSGQTQSVVLEVTVTREQPSSLFIFRGTTNPFPVQGVRRVSNRDLATSNGPAAIDDYEIGTEAQSVTETGLLPAGSYLFRFVVRTPQGVVLDEAQLRIDLGQATRIELLSPGSPAGDSPPLVNTPAPRFLWSTDGPVGGTTGSALPGVYRLKVVRADGAASGEEAMQGFASWETQTSSTSEIYPGAASALPLEAGATYAWQVIRQINTSSGIEELQSPIYWFRMGAGGSRGPSACGDDAAGAQLEQLLQVLGLAGDLGGFCPTGTLLVDGRPMSSSALAELLAAIAAGEIPVLSIKLLGGRE